MKNTQAPKENDLPKEIVLYADTYILHPVGDEIEYYYVDIEPIAPDNNSNATSM